MSQNDDIPFVTAVSGAPITELRPVPEDLDQRLNNPGLPRANVAATPEKPHGSWQMYRTNANLKNKSVLQQHISYFDRSNTGIVSPIDTFLGFWNLGFNVVICFFAAIIINGALSYPTQEGILPDPLFRIRIQDIHRAKHGSDSESYDTEGRFVPEKFEEIFSKYAKEDRTKESLTLGEIFEALKGNRNAMDPFGAIGGILEWGMAYLLVGKKGNITKEDIRGVMDGSLFYHIRDERKSKGGHVGERMQAVKENVGEGMQTVKENVGEAANAGRGKLEKEE